MKGGVSEKQKQEKACRKEAVVLGANTDQLRRAASPSPPTLPPGGGDGAFSLIRSDTVLHADSLRLVWASQRSRFGLRQRLRVISASLP